MGVDLALEAKVSESDIKLIPTDYYLVGVSR